jgi:DNA-binding MarR family transcriptional regulator
MQQPLKQQLTNRFVELVEQINQQMHCRPPDEWSDLELTISQVRTLALLQQEPQRMGSISAFLGGTLSSATSIIDRLVDRGLVERSQDPDDRRAVICGLTPQGREAIEQFWRIGRMRIVELAEQLDAAELEAVVHAMELLHKAAERVQGG